MLDKVESISPSTVLHGMVSIRAYSNSGQPHSFFVFFPPCGCAGRPSRHNKIKTEGKHAVLLWQGEAKRFTVERLHIGMSYNSDYKNISLRGDPDGGAAPARGVDGLLPAAR